MIFRTIIFILIALLLSGFLPLKNSQSFGERKRWKRRSEKITEKRIDLTFLDTLNRGKEAHLFDNNLNTLIEKKKEIPQGKKIIENGYRIQLAASSSEKSIQSEQESAEEELRIKTYVIFEKPYYKIFAGDFLTRKDAEKAISRIKKLGYPNAWIVKSDILVSK
jgi:hypothetical protein